MNDAPTPIPATKESVAEAKREVEECLKDPAVRRRLAQTGVKMAADLESGAHRISSKVMQRPAMPESKNGAHPC